MLSKNEVQKNQAKGYIAKSHANKGAEKTSRATERWQKERNKEKQLYF